MKENIKISDEEGKFFGLICCTIISSFLLKMLIQAVLLLNDVCLKDFSPTAPESILFGLELLCCVTLYVDSAYMDFSFL